MPYVTFQGAGSDAEPVHIRAEKHVGVSGHENGLTSVHMEGGSVFLVTEDPETVQEKLTAALKGTDGEIIEKDA